MSVNFAITLIILETIFTMLCGLLAFYFNIKTYLWLRHYDPETFRYITSIGDFEGVSNPVRGLKFLYSNQGEKEVQHLKKRTRFFLHLFLVSALTLACTITALYFCFRDQSLA